MEIKPLLLKKYGDHPEIDLIVHEVALLIGRIEAAWDAWDRPEFVASCRDLKRYQPPAVKESQIPLA